jgi:hypothetical protein
MGDVHITQLLYVPYPIVMTVGDSPAACCHAYRRGPHKVCMKKGGQHVRINLYTDLYHSVLSLVEPDWVRWLFLHSICFS